MMEAILLMDFSIRMYETLSIEKPRTFVVTFFNCVFKMFLMRSLTELFIQRY